MNNTSLMGVSLLAALLCHLLIFHFCTFVFPIDPPASKPGFFFLGALLKQNDVTRTLPAGRAVRVHAGSNRFGPGLNRPGDIDYETADTGRNLFAIQAVTKPFMPQPAPIGEKIAIKSTFETPPAEDAGVETETRQRDDELKIRPYKPLRFRSP